ncbi:sensor histidine kinase [Jiangella alkaliphila]|uniref:histidine kinase n=1 Tax=Jiangella alkaliphila TaxID=419479 RepID=A0A1H2KSK5_9ACTN|nr:histidine kinase [Jiangella alkaliphila]SDU71613.1 Signal transduction histidine kinase [Jiangella alkaliphila]
MTTHAPGPAASSPELPSLLPGVLRVDPDTADPARRGRVRRSVRDWIVDTLCFVIAILIGLTTYDSAMQNDPPELVQLLDLCVGALACLSLWWRRRWPVQLAVVVALLCIGVSSAAGAAVILMFTVAVHRRWAVAVAVAAVNVVTGLLFYGVYPDPVLAFRWTILLTGSLVAAVTLWGMLVRSRRQLVLSLRERAYQAENEAALRVERARHLERERIAREMHDVLAHRISLLSVHAGALEYRPDAPREDVVNAAGVIRASAHQALQDLREIIGVLRAPSSDDDPDRPQPTLAQLPPLVDESRQAGMRVTVVDELAGDGAEPPPVVARCAYRVVQEALTNVRKHAPGTGVYVTLTGGPGGGLAVEVRNRMPVGAGEPGTSLDIPGTGTGLIGLAERVELAGGSLEHGITRDGDFRVHAWLPWPA